MFQTDMKKLFLLCLYLFPLALGAEEVKHSYLHKMEIGATAGVPGLGLDVTLPVTDWMSVRTGFICMPNFEIPSNFGLETTSMRGTPHSSDKRRRMINLMKDFTGNDVDDNVEMLFTSQACNFKLLIDIMPFSRHKEWSFTAGFFVGNANVLSAKNSETGNNTLSSVNLYNSLYVKAITGEPIHYEKGDGTMGDFNLFEPGSEMQERICTSGMMGMPLGTFSNGDRAVMVPDKNNMAKARMVTNSFRPYLGAGYKTPLTKDKRLSLKVDAGVLFWGGKPHVYVDNVYRLPANTLNNGYYYDIVYYDEVTYEEHKRTPQTIDLTRDVHNIKGRVGNLVDLVKKFPVLPNLSVTLSYRL